MISMAEKIWIRTRLSLVAKIKVSTARDKKAKGKIQSGGIAGFFQGWRIKMPITVAIKPVMNQPRKAENGTPSTAPCMGQVVIRMAFAKGSMMKDMAIVIMAESKAQLKSCLGSELILAGFLSISPPMMIELQKIGMGQATPNIFHPKMP